MLRYLGLQQKHGERAIRNLQKIIMSEIMQQLMNLQFFLILETHNAQMIREGKSKEERFLILKSIADYQMEILSAANSITKIGLGEEQ